MAVAKRGKFAASYQGSCKLPFFLLATLLAAPWRIFAALPSFLLPPVIF